ncbi:MAG: glutamine--fructose-6-phosphate transaminase (isomerizing) [Clostridia bacterium]|nr:glutamine--fructose-6-phosphate transaminase (isomerizing) [Clostridia bacterium]
MCGIIGYIGPRSALPVLLNGLRRLEYRGYDSAGVALCPDGRIEVRKAQGHLRRLEEILAQAPPPAANAGVGHTRWATHGRPSDRNAHPHTDESGRFAVVHNGIIENYAELRDELSRRGHVFQTETDTEVVPHLLEEYYEGDLLHAWRTVLKRLRGAFALAAVAAGEPERIVAARRHAPLVIGLGEGEFFLASDIPALLDYTRRFLVLEEGEVAELTPGGVRVWTEDGRPVQRDELVVDWDADRVELGDYPHYMLKEIAEQPRALADTLRGRFDPAAGRVLLDGLRLPFRTDVRRVHLIACGTAYHAALVARTWIERWARLPAEAEVASEFRYRDPLIGPDTLVVAVSQSGETADTLAAVRLSRERGAPVLAVTNTVGSSLAREADEVCYTWAGPEIAVASTKAYTTQLAVLALTAAALAQSRGLSGSTGLDAVLKDLASVPDRVETVLASRSAVDALTDLMVSTDDAFFIGRGLDYAVALEGQLKLKEVSYIHAEAYPAGELKHGTLALIAPGVPVVALSTQPAVRAKLVANILEVRARGAAVIEVGTAGQAGAPDVRYVGIPSGHPDLSPLVAVVPLQLLAYNAAVARGADVDRPRNLAKSVTVE